MRSGLLVLFFFLSYFQLSAQEIRILDSDTGEPVAGVAIYNQDQSKYTIFLAVKSVKSWKI